MKTETVECDGCGYDLTRRSNTVDYRLVLDAESKNANSSDFYTDMMIYPAVDRAYHFCDLRCLDQWRSREQYLGKLWTEWNKKWMDEHGTKDKNGRVTSWPDARDEIRKARALEFEAAALAAFPMQAKK